MFTPERALSFGQVAGLYDRIRPTYPKSAIEWALGTAPRSVVDLGAGTGLLSRVLHAAGHRVIPVEPDDDMRAQLEAASDGLEARKGSAETIPVDDASVDAVVAGQAYHWFDKVRAHPEIARVLKPGGVFAPMWNVRDESVPWVSELTEVAGLGGDGSTYAAQLVSDFGPLFARPDRETFRHATTLTPDDLLTLVKSRSLYLTATAEQRTQLDAAVIGLTKRHPDLKGREHFDLPYVTYVYRARHDV